MHAYYRGEAYVHCFVRGTGASLRFSQVSNMVAVASCNFPIRLEGLALSHIKFASYEPELFPGLIYRLASPKMVMIIFVRFVRRCSSCLRHHRLGCT